MTDRAHLAGLKATNKGTGLLDRLRTNDQLRSSKTQRNLNKRRMYQHDNMFGAETSDDVTESSFDMTNYDEINTQLCSPSLDEVRIGMKKLHIVLDSSVNLEFQQYKPTKEVVARFLEIISSGADPALTYEATWFIISFSSADDGSCRVIVNCGGLDALFQLLCNGNMELVSMALWALANIIIDEVAIRDMALQKGIVAHLLRLVTSSANFKPDLVGNLVWAISNLTRLVPKPDPKMIFPLIPFLMSIVMNCPDPQVLENALWALAFIASQGESMINCILNTNVAAFSASNLRLCRTRLDGAPVSSMTQSTLHGFIEDNKLGGNAVVDMEQRICLGMLANYPFMQAFAPFRQVVFADTVNNVVLRNTCPVDIQTYTINTAQVPAAPHPFLVKIITLILHPDSIVSVTALRLIGNMIYIHDYYIQLLLINKFIDHLVVIIHEIDDNVKCTTAGIVNTTKNSKRTSLLKESCWIISNIICSADRSVDKVLLDNEILYYCVDFLNSPSREVCEEAVWVISNVVEKSESWVVEKLTSYGAVEALLTFLARAIEAHNNHSKALVAALNTLGLLLKFGEEHPTQDCANPIVGRMETANGLDILAQLERHPVSDVCEQAARLILQYFEDDGYE